VIKLTHDEELEASSSGIGSSPSEGDFDAWQISLLLDEVKTDYSAMNLNLLKRIWTEPRIKPSKRLDLNDPKN